MNRMKLITAFISEKALQNQNSAVCRLFWLKIQRKDN